MRVSSSACVILCDTATICRHLTLSHSSMSKIAVVSFPGMNCEQETVRACTQSGMDAFVFRWNEERERLNSVDGYILPGGFSYEDRGRAGMAAAHDPLLEFLREESQQGKPIIGICNGAQILVESGLIPLGHHLQFAIARNTTRQFINTWIWITPSCPPDRCAVSNWQGTMHIPIAHGEGRFTTRDRDLVQELQKNKQIAFSYCDEHGNIEKGNPNGSMLNIAGVCNPAGNIVALMPHPERSQNGDPFFQSLKTWMEKQKEATAQNFSWEKQPQKLPNTPLSPHEKFCAVAVPEIFIQTCITNNEEHTLEQVGKRIVPSLKLKQLRYIACTHHNPYAFLEKISHFNPHKERAYIRRNGRITAWNMHKKQEEPIPTSPFVGILFLRRDDEDASDEGICYVCQSEHPVQLDQRAFLEVLFNPHAHTLQKLLQ
ncbi:phosphoribosylformylglycinamidine synthase I [Candidatus Peregrinibacteria bacterium CG10_big_fil_rev_8_21_14_0_10_49_16]|nr:MAG: phosphoribosylformylglycinamidine synthase I [Candidatus Peregrinibacteria bacterium CG10_big_fil_rev_8_21_14_0_10_49_16]